MLRFLQAITWSLFLGQAVAATDTVVREIPTDPWVKSFFEAIDPLADKAGLEPLRAGKAPEDDKAVRMYIGFGLGGLQGYAIARRNGVWTGSKFQSDGSKQASRFEKSELKPKTTWDDLWATLCDRGLLTLADFSTLPPSNYWPTDGVGVVVEVFEGNKYRTYMYPNPSQFDNEECRQLERLWMTFLDQVGQKSYPLRERKFLSKWEIRQVAWAIRKLKYPISAADFFKAMPFDFRARDLVSNGSTSGSGFSWSEIHLTNRSDRAGHWALRTYDVSNFVVRHAEIVFHDRELESPLVLQPESYPSDQTRLPEIGK
ncbi:MAG: hypothetical protein JNN01_12060 [Opitutaceae bacterium]|nr:hypothetical protein [Opitutaceae bacterium]